ncbi:MAG: uracil-DNA glycosylase [Caldivirga sp.]
MNINVKYQELVESLAKCRLCDRLVKYRESVKPSPRFMGEEYWRRPVPPWGDLSNPRLMIVGLAPAAHGGNRTGRMFTGDSSAQFLFKALHQCGLSNNPYSINRADGTIVKCVYITSVVKCAPPGNKPTTIELRNCVSNWFVREMELVRPRVIVTLGAVAWSGVLMALGLKAPFKHGKILRLNGLTIYASYHPSPRNTNTGRLSLNDLVNILRAASREAGCFNPQPQGTPQGLR